MVMEGKSVYVGEFKDKEQHNFSLNCTMRERKGGCQEWLLGFQLVQALGDGDFLVPW